MTQSGTKFRLSKKIDLIPGPTLKDEGNTFTGDRDMRFEQALKLARRLGWLQGQKGVDEDTRLRCADEVEEVIMANSTVFDKGTHLRQWREAAKKTYGVKVVDESPKKHFTMTVSIAFDASQDIQRVEDLTCHLGIIQILDKDNKQVPFTNLVYTTDEVSDMTEEKSED